MAKIGNHILNFDLGLTKLTTMFICHPQDTPSPIPPFKDSWEVKPPHRIVLGTLFTLKVPPEEYKELETLFMAYAFMYQENL